MTSPCTPIERPAGRHDLVFVSPQGWRAMLATRGDLAADPLVARWPDKGWPTIRRRAMPGETSGVRIGPAVAAIRRQEAGRLSIAAERHHLDRPPAFAEGGRWLGAARHGGLRSTVSASSRFGIRWKRGYSAVWRGGR